ncbi:sensor histidine kinase [Nocardia arthritidis]|uniref:histidine kinase n=1 Tax=Nocardia arthritidis TaxID=228602 RepID=A0A6G9YFQ8_9NOCA|nr:HAMP domain-containing sensor histidine kinase [Nocardia arthritidis]QIS11813.1 HAMP domain-containing protein [Nocardia arthritidis]
MVDADGRPAPPPAPVPGVADAGSDSAAAPNAADRRSAHSSVPDAPGLAAHASVVVPGADGAQMIRRPASLSTVSLRRRVTAISVVLVAIALAALVVLANALFGLVADRGMNAILTDRMREARELSARGVPAQQLVFELDQRSVRARLVLPDGQVLGSLTEKRIAHGQTMTRTIELTGPAIGRARLTLGVDTGILAGARARLWWLVALSGTAALVATALALSIGVGRALAPLDTMTRLAREIAHGRRGIRLAPTRADTELGRTAAAFDEMLDELEGAEARAIAAEERTRTFVADAAHELRTPITGIAAVAEAVLRESPDADPEERERLHLLLVREAHRAGRLVDDLLDLARIDAGALELHREPVELRALAQTQVDRVAVQHPELTVAVDGDEVTVGADPARISQILANLLDNACRATPSGGRVTVSIGRRADIAEVLITDTGVGVPDAERERIFDRLVRLDRDRGRATGGSGLGLPIARGYARAHGGELACLPADSGAEFLLTLPV